MKNLCNLGFPKSAKWRFWSDCASAQADPNFRWAHVSVGIVSDVAIHFNQWRDGYKSHRFQVGHGFKISSNDKYLNWDNESTCYRVRKLYSRTGARTLDSGPSDYRSDALATHLSRSHYYIFSCLIEIQSPIHASWETYFHTISCYQTWSRNHTGQRMS